MFGIYFFRTVVFLGATVCSCRGYVELISLSKFSKGITREHYHRCMRRHASDLAWRPIIKDGDIDEIVVAMDKEEANIDIGGPRFEPSHIYRLKGMNIRKPSKDGGGTFCLKRLFRMQNK